jgi:hypothetical protein
MVQRLRGEHHIDWKRSPLIENLEAAAPSPRGGFNFCLSPRASAACADTRWLARDCFGGGKSPGGFMPLKHSDLYQWLREIALRAEVGLQQP